MRVRRAKAMASALPPIKSVIPIDSSVAWTHSLPHRARCLPLHFTGLRSSRHPRRGKGRDSIYTHLSAHLPHLSVCAGLNEQTSLRFPLIAVTFLHRPTLGAQQPGGEVGRLFLLLTLGRDR